MPTDIRLGSRSSAFDLLPAIVLVSDADGRYLDANRAATELLGWSREELLAMRAGDLVVANAGALDSERRWLVEDGSWNGSVDLLHRDGSTRTFQFHASRLVSDGQDLRIGVGLELGGTPHHLRSTDRLSAAIVESTDDAVFSKALDGTILSWNPGAERMYGYTAKEVIGKHVGVLADEEHQAEIAFFLAEVAQGRHVRNYETIRRRKNGSAFWVAVTVSPVTSEDGTVMAASTIARDITRRRQAEEDLRTARDQLQIITQNVGAGITIQDPDGNVVYANQAAAELSGFPSVKGLSDTQPVALTERFDIWDEDGEPLHWSDLPGRRALAGERGCEAVLHYRDRETGEEAWRLVRADPVLDQSGEVRFAVNIFRDITAMKRDEERLRFRQALLTAETEASHEGILVVSPAGAVVSSNERFGEMWGLSGVELPTHAAAVEAMRERVLDPRRFVEVVRDYEEHPRAEGIDLLRLEDGRMLERHTQPLVDGDRTFGRIWFFDDVTKQRAREDRQGFLLGASRLLAGSLDYRGTLTKVAQLAVPALADWSAIDILDDAGSITPLAIAHRDPAMAEWAWQIKEMIPSDPEAATGVPAVIRTGRAELHPVVEPLLAEALTEIHDAELREKMERLQLRSAMVVPLAARGKRFGAMTFVQAESGRRYDEDDLALAEDLAARASLAIDNARIYEERDHIARVLQRSLLPPALPEVPGFTLDARYLPSGAGIEVGGDFYDVFALGQGSWGFAMGDVCGKGPDAAALMGMVRYTLRAAAMSTNRPSDILRILNEAVLAQASDGRFCTVTFVRAVLAVGGIRLTVCSGGHPLPVVLRADGQVETLGTYGTLIGAFPEITLTDHAAELFPGDMLVLYTDGVTDEQHEGEEFGEERLRELLGSLRGNDPGTITASIERAVAEFVQGEPRDDLAVLVARVEP